VHLPVNHDISRRLFLALGLPALLPVACGDRPGDGAAGAPGAGPAPAEPSRLVVYCGRSKSMVEGVFDAHRKANGVELEVRYGDSTALANQIIEEGAASPADVFFAQDAGALGALSAKQLLAALPDPILQRVDPRFRGRDRTWVGTSGRARVVCFNTERLKPEDLPPTMDGFTDPKWKKRLGWAPSNASFQAYVTAVRKVKGDAAAEAWLLGVRANEPREYPKNGPAVQAVAKGEVDVAFVNHYYLHRLRKEAAGAPFPAENFYPPGDLGAMMNVAGAAILKTSKAPRRAESLIEALLAEPAQVVFAHENFEYPLAGSVKVAPGVPEIATLRLPEIDVSSLDDLEGTLALLRKTKALP
jgi:iron(III) transport system substrate-binding protein